jgi:hypothetical protein
MLYLERLPKELVNASRQEQQAAMLSILGEALVVHHIDPELLDAIEPNEERAAFALIQ